MSDRWILFYQGGLRRDGNEMRVELRGGRRRGGYWEFRFRHLAIQFAARKGIAIQ